MKTCRGPKTAKRILGLKNWKKLPKYTPKLAVASSDRHVGTDPQSTEARAAIVTKPQKTRKAKKEAKVRAASSPTTATPARKEQKTPKPRAAEVPASSESTTPLQLQSRLEHKGRPTERDKGDHETAKSFHEIREIMNRPNPSKARRPTGERAACPDPNNLRSGEGNEDATAQVQTQQGRRGDAVCGLPPKCASLKGDARNGRDGERPRCEGSSATGRKMPKGQCSEGSSATGRSMSKPMDGKKQHDNMIPPTPSRERRRRSPSPNPQCRIRSHGRVSRKGEEDGAQGHSSPAPRPTPQHARRSRTSEGDAQQQKTSASTSVRQDEVRRSQGATASLNKQPQVACATAGNHGAKGNDSDYEDYYDYESEYYTDVEEGPPAKNKRVEVKDKGTALVHRSDRSCGQRERSDYFSTINTYLSTCLVRPGCDSDIVLDRLAHHPAHMLIVMIEEDVTKCDKAVDKVLYELNRTWKGSGLDALTKATNSTGSKTCTRIGHLTYVVTHNTFIDSQVQLMFLQDSPACSRVEPPDASFYIVRFGFQPRFAEGSGKCKKREPQKDITLSILNMRRGCSDQGSRLSQQMHESILHGFEQHRPRFMVAKYGNEKALLEELALKFYAAGKRPFVRFIRTQGELYTYPLAIMCFGPHAPRNVSHQSRKAALSKENQVSPFLQPLKDLPTWLHILNRKKKARKDGNAYLLRDSLRVVPGTWCDLGPLKQIPFEDAHWRIEDAFEVSIWVGKSRNSLYAGGLPPRHSKYLRGVPPEEDHPQAQDPRTMNASQAGTELRLRSNERSSPEERRKKRQHQKNSSSRSSSSDN